MMEENVNASMEIKTVDENGFVNNNVKEDTCECCDHEQPVIRVCLKRTADGLVRDDENGKEISSIFNILEPGDQVNHQTVTKIEPGQITLDYFGKETILTNEAEIFSVLIKEEIENWKSLLKVKDLTRMFEFGNDDMVHLFRALDLICMNTNVEEVDLLASPYTSDNVILDQRILTMIFGTLRKPILDSQEDLKGARVVNIMYDYNRADVEEVMADVEKKNGVYLYTIALFNSNDEEISDKDKIILC